MGAYRGPAMITADSAMPVEVDAHLVRTRDRDTGEWTWRGRVTPVLGVSLLTYFLSEELQLHVHGQTAAITFTTLDVTASEIHGVGAPPF